MRDDLGRFEAADAVVYGINPASADAHQNYIDKKGFNFRLLSDPERKVAGKYNALKGNGKSILRTVYVIDKEGKIVFAKRGMPSDNDILGSI